MEKDKRRTFIRKIGEINDLILSYAMGNYERKGHVSDDKDELDSVLAGINMLGEELMTTTVSRNYFTSIYHAVADMLFVLTDKGIITRANRAAEKILGYEEDELIGYSIEVFLAEGKNGFFSQLKNKLKKQPSTEIESRFKDIHADTIPISVSCSVMHDEFGQFTGYLFIAKDISEKKELNKLIMRTIVETQEREQKRVAEDLHDSFGQELSALKLMLSGFEDIIDNLTPRDKETLNTCERILDSSIQSLREICFDLRPQSLERGGIHYAVYELLARLKNQSKIHFSFSCPEKLENLSKEKEVVIFRIIQELINNSIKHSKASNVRIVIKQGKDQLNVSYKDNGTGFDVDEMMNKGKGNGLRNMQTRIDAFGGTLKVESKIGKGCAFSFVFLLNKKNG